MECFKTIDEGNRMIPNKPPDPDMSYYPGLQEWYTNEVFRSRSIRCVPEHSLPLIYPGSMEGAKKQGFHKGADNIIYKE